MVTVYQGELLDLVARWLLVQKHGATFDDPQGAIRECIYIAEGIAGDNGVLLLSVIGAIDAFCHGITFSEICYRLGGALGIVIIEDGE